MKKLYVAFDVDNHKRIFGYFFSREEFQREMCKLWHIKKISTTWFLYDKKDIENKMYTKIKFEVGLREVEAGKFYEYGI